MDILTWNINGIRASKISIKNLLDSLDCDIICLQETKVTRDLLDESIANIDGYSSYFSFSRKRTGYSGVATYCRDSANPVRAEEGLSGRLAKGSDDVGCYGDQASFTDEELRSLDGEGRAIMTQHKIRDVEGEPRDLVVINVYCPRADRENQERMTYKLQFYNLLQLRAEALVNAGRYVVVVGDINVSHRRIDNCDPGPDFDQHPSRLWLSSFLQNCEPTAEYKTSEDSDHNDDESSTSEHQRAGPTQGVFVDTFRRFHPTREKAFTCWSTLTGARQTNYGTRIDYVFANATLFDKLVSTCDIMPEVEGSDHCPVKARLNCQPVPSQALPQLCSSNMPEFSGKQQKLMSFFQRLSPSKVALARKEESQEVRPRDKIDPKAFDSSKPGLKRAGSDPSTQRSQKKPRLNPGEKQKGSLMNFFTKKTNSQVDSAIDKTDLDTERKPELCETAPACFGNRTTKSKDFDLESQEIHEASSNHDSSQSLKIPDADKKTPASAWKKLLSGPPPAPLCKGHSEPCLLRTVKKPGPNLGKKFYVCPRPEGHKDDQGARCNTFIWVSKSK